MRVQETSALHLGMAPQTWPQDDTRPPVSVTGMARQPPLQDHACHIMSQMKPARDLATHPMLPTAITARSATLNHSSSNRTDLPTSQLSGSEGSITLAEVFAWPVPHFLAAATLVGHSGLLLLRLEAPPSQLVSRTTGSLAAPGGGGGYDCFSPPAPPLPSAQQGFEGGQSYGGLGGQPRFVQYNQGQAWPAQPNMGQAPLQQNSWVQGGTCPESGNGWGNF